MWPDGAKRPRSNDSWGNKGKHTMKEILKILFIFREGGREGEREGEKHQCVVASHVPPTGDLA